MDEILPRSLVDAVTANYRRCVESGHSITYEEALQLPVGLRYFQTTLIPVKDATGRVHRLVGIGHHITERVEAEQATHLLADASRILAESLDYQGTLAHVARLAVPVLADWCVVDLLQSDGSLRRVAVTARDARRGIRPTNPSCRARMPRSRSAVQRNAPRRAETIAALMRSAGSKAVRAARRAASGASPRPSGSASATCRACGSPTWGTATTSACR